MARNFAHNGTNRQSIFQSDKIFNKLDNKLQSLNIETCETNTSFLKGKKLQWKIQLQEYMQFKFFASKYDIQIFLYHTYINWHFKYTRNDGAKDSEYTKNN